MKIIRWAIGYIVLVAVAFLVLYYYGILYFFPSPILIFVFIGIYLFLELLYSHINTTFSKKWFSRLPVFDYLTLKLDYYAALSKGSSFLYNRSSLEEEARKLLNQEQYRLFSNKVDDMSIKIYQSIIPRIIFRYLLPSFLILMSIVHFLIDYRTIVDYLRDINNPNFRLIGIALILFIIFFLYFSLIKKLLILFMFDRKLEKIEEQHE